MIDDIKSLFKIKLDSFWYIEPYEAKLQVTVMDKVYDYDLYKDGLRLIRILIDWSKDRYDAIIVEKSYLTSVFSDITSNMDKKLKAYIKEIDDEIVILSLIPQEIKIKHHKDKGVNIFNVYYYDIFNYTVCDVETKTWMGLHESIILNNLDVTTLTDDKYKEHINMLLTAFNEAKEQYQENAYKSKGLIDTYGIDVKNTSLDEHHSQLPKLLVNDIITLLGINTRDLLKICIYRDINDELWSATISMGNLGNMEIAIHKNNNPIVTFMGILSEQLKDFFTTINKNGGAYV